MVCVLLVTPTSTKFVSNRH